MTAEQVATSANVICHDQQPRGGDSRAELLAGLMSEHRFISPKYLYDAAGSRLFERITALPEYYPTRTEKAILGAHGPAMGAACGEGCVLIEPGSGSSEKVRLLLEDMRPAAYVALDISADFLWRSARRLGEAFPWLQVRAICADFNRQWRPPGDLPPGRRVVFYPGSTIGNLEPGDARAFLGEMRAWMGDDGGALVGVDQHKDEGLLHAAYNDAQGVTAAFNRNVLHHVNHILGADFAPERFRHHAFYNRDARRIEMHLVAEEAQQVNLGGPVIELDAGDSIHTENSYKYSPGDFSALCREAGLGVHQRWSDPGELFSVYYLGP
ncbi:L-histidine N(alpha)-methyltransferase [Parahaliea mediterranea]|uniref:L-histidine N(Alpha)-methyltransferase n=1 Tax=Parahaliea mediterranea TaxID=651086 RepID=A0A939DET2_9GAMM|nr:L-histidine N(alpha)-methyltransferase [Parahaliea mediterranea]MBN7796810.1 L-histidine N(alpha)-methyltransferase [Parahaliea mediterranea]